jgi:RNA polymerase sigma-70 factor (ECF subfamily)
VDAALARSEPSPAGHWLEPIYRRHAAAVIRTAYRVTGSASDAEDVLHTVFERLARRVDPPDLSRGAAAYLRRAATNAALDLVQSRANRSTTALEAAPYAAIADPTPGPDRLHQARDLARLLREALATMSRRQAEIFVLRYLEDLDNQGIATLLGTTPGTVAVTLHRIRERLAAELAPHLGGSP